MHNISLYIKCKNNSFISIKHFLRASFFNS